VVAKQTLNAIFELNTLSETGATTMRLLRFLSASRRLPWVYVLLALVLCAPAAHAATYSFTISASTLLADLTAVTPTAYQNDAGYYAIFFQPVSGPTLTSTNTTESSPKPSGSDDWQATLDISSPFNSGSNMIEFTRNNSLSYVTVLANTASYNTIVADENGNNVPAISGTVPWVAGKVDSDTFTNTFTFTISGMASNLAGTSVPFTVDAAYLHYCTPAIATVFTTINMTAQTPEPGTILLFGLGLASVLAGVIRKRAKTTPAA